MSTQTFFKSDSINDLASALAKAQSEFPSIPKNKTAEVVMKSGGKYFYKYADLADVLGAVLPVCSKHGLAITQLPGKDSLVTILMHSGGQHIGSEYPLSNFEKIQECGSELTYARRYTVCAILGVHGEEDEDGGLANQGKKNKKPVPPPVAPTDDVFAKDDRTSALQSLVEAAKKRGWKNEEVASYIKTTFQKNGVKELSVKDIKDLTDEIIKYTYEEAMKAFSESFAGQ